MNACGVSEVGMVEDGDGDDDGDEDTGVYPVN